MKIINAEWEIAPIQKKVKVAINFQIVHLSINNANK